MKKIFAFFAICAAVAAVSCTKEKDFDSPVKLGKFVFTATHDAEAEEDAKTSVDLSTGAVTWSEDDQVKVFTDTGLDYTSELLAAADAGQASATFTVSLGSGETPQLAVYPDAADAAFDYANTKVTVTIPATQGVGDAIDGTFGKAAIEVAKVNGSTLSFKNVCGLLQVVVNNADARKVVISSNDNSSLVGQVPVSFNGNSLVLDDPVNTGTSLTLNIPGSGTYYASVLPGTNLKAGFYVQVLDGSDALLGEILTSNVLEVARRQMRKLNLGSANSVIGNKIFVTVNGAGSKSGADWENALDAAGFYSFVTTASTDAKVFMAAGTYTTTAGAGYTLNTGITGLSVYGGYPSTATGTSLAGRDIVNNPTVLSGNGTNRILVTNGGSITAVLDGLEFRNAHASDSQGKGMGSALCINNCSNIKVLNCVFSDNINETTTKETSTGTAANGGGAVRAVGGTILFKGCSFSNNSSTAVGGGAMRVGGSGNVTLDGCVFSDNEAKTNGGAIHMNKGTLTVKDCQFNNNTAATNGGAISITQQTACTVNMSGTSFYHNRAASKSGYCGGAIAVGPCTDSWDLGSSDVTLTDCYFEENMGHETDITSDLKNSITEANASTGGAIFVEKSATVKLNHCKFYHNLSSQNGGAIRTKATTALLYMNACSFYMNYAGKYAAAIQGTSGPIAMYNCVFYNNQNKTGTYPGTVRSSAGEILFANTSLRLGSSYPGAVFSGTTKSVIVNSIFVNSGAGSTPEAKKAISVSQNKTVSSFGHNLHSGYNADGSTYGTIDETNAPAGSDQEIGLDDYPAWVGTVNGVGYHLLKITALPAAYYTDPGVDYRATPAEVEAAIDYFDTQNSTAFKAWLNTLDEGSGRKPLQVDYRGYLRSTAKIWPGSYEYNATK